MNEHGARVVLSDVICEFLEVAIHLILFVRGIYPPELFESTQKYGCPIRTARHPGLTSYIQQIIRSIKAELQKGTIHRICIVTLDSTGQALDRFVFEMSMLQAFEGKVLSSALAQLDQDQDVAMNNVAAPNSKNSRVASMDEKGKSKATDYQNDDQANYHADIDDPEMGEEGDDEEEDGEEALLLRRALAHGKYRRQRQQQHQQQQQQQQPYRPQEHGEVRFESLITFTTNVEALLRAILLKISICDSYLKPVVEDASFTVVIEMKNAGVGPDAKPEFPWTPICDSVPGERSKLSTIPGKSSPQRRIIPVKTISFADIQLELFIEQLKS